MNHMASVSRFPLRGFEDVRQDSPPPSSKHQISEHFYKNDVRPSSRVQRLEEHEAALPSLVTS